MLEAFVFLAGVVFVLPLVSIILTIVHNQRQKQLDQKTDALQDGLDALTVELKALDDRLTAIETPREIPRPDAAEAVVEPPTLPPEPIIEPLDDLDEALKEPEPEPEPAPAEPRVTHATSPTTPASRPGWTLERQFGTRAVVWLGAVALALAGAFLVKYSIDQGLIGPTTRVVLGLAFGAVLLGAAEWLRRRSAGIAQGLAAAGIAVLYAALLAGTKNYDLFPDLVGGAGMALTTATAVFLSMRHGQLVAVLGLLGGFLTPILIGSETPRPWLLSFYLLMLQSGLLIVSRRKRWGPVAGLTLVATVGWTALWLADLSNIGGGTTVVGFFLLGSLVTVVATSLSASKAEAWGESGLPRLLVWAGAGAGAILMSALVGVGDFGWIEWIYFAILGAGCLFLARRDTTYEGLPWLAAAFSAGTLLIWGIDLPLSDHLRYWQIAVMLGVVHAGGPYLLVWSGSRADRWAALSGLSGFAFLLVAYFGLHEADFPIAWGIQSLLLAAVFTALAWPLLRRRGRLQQGDAALAALIVTVTALVSVAVPMEFERAWIGLLWALEIPALAWLAIRLRLPVLEKAAWVLGGAVALRLLLNPAIFDYPIGDAVVLNWTLYGYGVPALAFLAAAALFRRCEREGFADVLETGAVALGFAFLSLNIRQFFHPGDLDATRITLTECGTFTIVWLLYGLGLLLLHRSSGRRSHKVLGTICGTLALAQGLAMQGLFANPLHQSYEVGATRLFNSLLFVYGLPALLAVLFGRELTKCRETIAARIAGCTALIFAFLTVTLEVRQAFHGSVLSRGVTSNAEMYTYSLVWILFATALLIAGIATRGVVLRYGSAAVMLVAVGKVFLVDTANLQDLYRVFSLFGLGVSLMLLAYLYQRFVFGGRAGT